jgi:ABC-type uncharacterized transport system ATPase subunit
MSAPILAGKALTKVFGETTALDRVSLSLFEGAVTAIIGENGAGKSTLAKILAGILEPDAGSIETGGAPTPWRSRREAVAAGVGFVPQALSFITTLSLVENHLIGAARTDRRTAARALGDACRELGVALPLDVPLGGLSLPQRQLAEIASAVAAGARVLLLDEPTSSLGPVEIASLVGALRRLAQSGTAVGLVTHRIAEVLNGADHVSVLRAGRPIFDGATAGLTADRIAHFMVGETVPEAARPAPHRETVRMSVEGICLEEGDVSILSEISFAARAGEVIGIAGVASTSQNALADVLAGLRRPRRGRVLVGEQDVTGNPVAALSNGVAHIPQERTTGIVPDLTVAENASLLRSCEPGFARFGFRSSKAERRQGERIVNEWDVRPRRYGLAAGALSGGNQQKLLVGRELDRTPSVIVAHGPTQGLDIAAAAAIRRRLVEAAAGGAAVIVISADLDEILAISHRVIVLSSGRIADVLTLADGQIDMVRLGRAIGGKTSVAAAETQPSFEPTLVQEVA